MKKCVLTWHICTLFPEIFTGFRDISLVKKAYDKGIIDILTHDMRSFALDKHNSVDDKPYGGGPGMLIKPDIVYATLVDIYGKKLVAGSKPRVNKSTKIILLDPAGTPFTQAKARSLAKLESVTLVCGRYEGFDARVHQFVDERISIGPYVLAGGEVPAMTIVESVSRLIPGFLGNEASARDESHADPDTLEYPQYTRPPALTVRGKNGDKILRVPRELTGGNHAEIHAWRDKKKKSLK